MPRIVVVTVRDDNRGGWILEVDAPDLDPWQIRAYLAEALDIAEARIDSLGMEDDDD
jgi:hypothetical protein